MDRVSYEPDLETILKCSSSLKALSIPYPFTFDDPVITMISDGSLVPLLERLELRLVDIEPVLCLAERRHANPHAASRFKSITITCMMPKQAQMNRVTVLRDTGLLFNVVDVFPRN
jgi:hypothetical protein